MSVSDTISGQSIWLNFMGESGRRAVKHDQELGLKANLNMVRLGVGAKGSC